MDDKKITIEKDDEGKISLYIDGVFVTKMDPDDKMTSAMVTEEDMTKMEYKLKETLMKAITESVADRISVKSIKNIK